MTREQAKTFYYLFEASKKCFVDEIDTLFEMFNTREYIPHIYTFINSVVHSKIYFFSLLLVFFSLINIFFYLFLTSSYFGNSIFSRFVNPDIYLFFTIYFTLFVLCLLPILYPVPVDCFVREFLDKLVSSETHTRLYIFNIGSNVDEYDSKGFDKKLNDNYFLRYFLLDGALQEPSSLVVRGKKVTN